MHYQTQKSSFTNAVKYASNFQFDISFGDKVEMGIKFGSPTATTEASTYEVSFSP
jgi:hypothetical protein